MQLACRGCRIPINSLDGCALCKDFKKQLVAVDEQEEDKPSLSTVASESVATLRTMIKRAKELLASKEVKKFERGADLALKAGNTAAKVLDSARKLQHDGLEVIKTMSFLEKAELFIGWYVTLPPEYRKRVKLEQDKMELAGSKPLELSDGA